MRNSEIDELIIETLGTQQRKTALIIAKVSERTGLDPDYIAQKLYRLVETGRLLAIGDVRRWRWSEVKRASTTALHLRM